MTIADSPPPERETGKSDRPARTVPVTLPARCGDLLDQLARIGLYGASAEEAARYLLLRSIDDLTRCGILAAHRTD